MMKQILVILAGCIMFFSLNAQPVKIMLITGGHSYDTIRFLKLFKTLDNVEYEHFVQPDANKAIAAGDIKRFDVLVFYDMWQKISEQEKEAYLKLTMEGKPFLFLHHSLVSYQQWLEFEQILGGRYVDRSPGVPAGELSSYRHDVWIDVEIVDPEHPVTKGMENFRIFDEVYGNYKVGPQIKPLLKTNHPESTSVIAWENHYQSSVIIFLQPGHDHHAYESDEYRELIQRSVQYLAGKNLSKQ
jgi:uncharacterized protein